MVSDDEPLVMGHEASGIVHSVGSAVSRLRPGDRVAIEPGFPCRRCKQCKAGKYNICPDMKFAADPPSHGTLTRLFKIPEDFVYKIPDSLSLEEAVLVEPLSVAVHATRLAQLHAGQSVLIQGSGTIGLLMAAVARAFGVSNIILADIKRSKLDFAQSFVPCKTFLLNLASTPKEEASRLRDENDQEYGVDAVIECTGAESSVQTGLYAVAAGGVLVQVGIGKPEQTLPIQEMCDKEAVLKMSFRYGSGDYETALDLLKSGMVSVKPLISSVVPFENAADAWEKTRKGEGIKNLIRGIQD